MKQLHHVVMHSHSAQTFLAFLTDVVGMEVQFQMRVPGEVLEATLGWPPSDGADVTMLGCGAAGLIEVLDVPEHLRDIAPEGLAALSFLTVSRRRAVLLHHGRCADRIRGRLCPRTKFGEQRRHELLSSAPRGTACVRVLSEWHHANSEIGNACVPVAAQPGEDS